MVEILVILALLLVAVALYTWRRARSRKPPRSNAEGAGELNAHTDLRVDPVIQLNSDSEPVPQRAEWQSFDDHSNRIENPDPSTYSPGNSEPDGNDYVTSQTILNGESDPGAAYERQVQKSDDQFDAQSAQQAGCYWYLPGEIASVGNLTLTAGWVYVGVDLPAIDGSGNDPCLIDLELELGSASQGMSVPAGNAGRKPSISYARLSPGHRRDYLEWLARNRATNEVADFLPLLFFIGIERRVIVDVNHEVVSDDELAALIEELLRLRDLFSQRKKVVGAANRLIGLCLAKTSTVDPAVFNIDFFGVDHFEWNRLQFAEKILSGVYAGEAALVSRYVLSSPDLDVKSRYGDGYSADLELFEARFTEAYPDGLPVDVSDVPLRLNYDCLNESIRGRFELICDDVQEYELSSVERSRLIELWESSRRDVGAHRRFVSQQKNRDERNGLTELSLLPTELLIRNSAFNAVRDLLEKTVTAGEGALPIVTLLNLVGEDTSQLPKKTARMVAELCENAGFGSAPDARIHGIKPIITRNIQVFRKRMSDTSTDFSPTFNLNVLLVRLSALVSKSDERVVYEETLAINSFIENDASLSQFERSSLTQLLRWCLENKSAMAGIKKLTSNLSVEMRELVWDRLVSVAKSDRQLHSAEVSKLDRLYDVLDLDPSKKSHRVSRVHSEVESVTNTVDTQAVNTSDNSKAATIPDQVDESKSLSTSAGPESRDVTPSRAPVTDQGSLFEQGIDSTQSVQSKWAQVTRGKRSSTGGHAGIFAKKQGGKRDHPVGLSGYTAQEGNTPSADLAGADTRKSLNASSDALDSSPTMKSGFLDLDKLAKLEEEHAKAGDLLASIFTDDDEESEADHYDGHELDSTDTAGSNSESVSEEGIESINVKGLDAKHNRLYMTLRDREEWPRTEYLDYCRELGLMPDGALEVINDWACEMTGDPLLESDDKTVYFDRDISSELEND